MSLSLFCIVLCAAALHAGWNAIVKIKLDPFLTMTLICIACTLIAIPAWVVVGLPDNAAWPWVGASIMLHFGYYLFLALAYRRADMSQVYPIARGTAPLMTAFVSIFFVHEHLGLGNLIGIFILAFGVLLVSLRGHREQGASSGMAIVYALATGLMISAYTLVDGLGARAAGSPHTYAAVLFVGDSIPMVALFVFQNGLKGFRPAQPFIWPALAGGAMSLLAYWIVIWAMSQAPIALVAAVRETSVLFGAMIAVVVLKEPMTRVRALAACTTVLGLIAMRLW